MDTSFYKCCAVPMCKSTSIRTPKKLFIHVPKNAQIRRKWLKLAKRHPASLTPKSTSYFCEDHFDLQNDMENYVQYTTMGVVGRIRMRPGCLPTKFACQPMRAKTFTDDCRPAAAKRQRLVLINECEEEIKAATFQQSENLNIEVPNQDEDSKFSELSDEFEISISYACKIFTENVSKIAEVMRPFIVNLDKASIKRCLPIAYRKNYYNVTCIIDCLEIEIQTPGKALHQALTWSEYKKTNTIKYLISSTPNGLVNYISQGYGGRISDVCLVENCGFLNSLPIGAHVMADRGFKHIETLLLGIQCKLIRPPSIVSGNKLSKEEVKETKKIASLRIHIERVIRRVREFSFLKPHACINKYLIGRLDDVIAIACGLINLQNSLINK
ncbi:unnamed protein product [Euphydryas editha]|uniref:THAP-type domain-containing protein n=1 Tax=Euphydryas editha TaxID=104508 RepID=A0AAU9UZB7_EUPED|nr:unnamed protein product [Euphydryas editha]